MKIDKIKLGISLAATVIILLLLIPFSTAAAEPAKISFFGPSEVAPGSTFSIGIDIGPVTNLKLWQFDVNYDKSVIQVTGSENGTGIVSGLIDKTIMTVTSWKFQPQGTPGNSVRVMGQVSSPVSGSGYLAEIRFSVLGAAGKTSQLTFSNVALYDNTAVLITSTPVNSTISVVANPKPAPTRSPTPTTAPTATGSPTPTSSLTPTSGATTTPTGTTTSTTSAAPTSTKAMDTSPPAAAGGAAKINIAVPEKVPAGANFVIRLDISKVTNLDTYYLLFKYDPAVVNVNDVTPGLIASTDIPIQEWSFVPSQMQGQIKIMGNVQGSKGANGAGYLAKIRCQIVGTTGDKSELSISNVGLLDMLAKNIEISPVATGTVTVTKGTPTSGLSSKLMYIIIGAVAGLVVIGLILFYFFFWRKRGKKPTVRGPVPQFSQGRTTTARRPGQKATQTQDPDQMLEAMRDRLSQLSSRRKPPPRN